MLKNNMEKKRFIDQREHRFTISEPIKNDPTIIVCPKCNKMAKVHLNDIQPEIGYSVKAICSSCGFVKEKTTAERKLYWQEEEPSDGFFDYRLWMKTSCCGHSLWAFNRRHLEFLENYVKAELRENPKDNLGCSNSSLASRLPKWIKAGGNRKRVIECLSKLRKLGEL